MIRALKNLDVKVVERILSDLASNFLPSPGFQTQFRQVEYDPSVYETVKEEMHQLLKVDPSDLSPTKQAKVYEFLARQMGEVALAGADLDSIKSRVGQRGDLRPDLYEIEFAGYHFPINEFGIRRNHVEDAIRNFDDVQEIEPDRMDGLSVYLKIHNKLSDHNRFALLVITARLGHVIYVVSAWRFYHSYADMSRARTVLDFLQTFVDSFGLPITLADKSGKFFPYEIVEAQLGTRVDQLVHVQEPIGRVFINYYFKKSLIQNLYAFALLFAIDGEKYIADLKEHGVMVSDEFPYWPPQYLK